MASSHVEGLLTLKQELRLTLRRSWDTLTSGFNLSQERSLPALTSCWVSRSTEGKALISYLIKNLEYAPDGAGIRMSCAGREALSIAVMAASRVSLYSGRVGRRGEEGAFVGCDAMGLSFL